MMLGVYVQVTLRAHLLPLELTPRRLRPAARSCRSPRLRLTRHPARRCARLRALPRRLVPAQHPADPRPGAHHRDPHPGPRRRLHHRPRASANPLRPPPLAPLARLGLVDGGPLLRRPRRTQRKSHLPLLPVLTHKRPSPTKPNVAILNEGSAAGAAKNPRSSSLPFCSPPTRSHSRNKKTDFLRE